MSSNTQACTHGVRHSPVKAETEDITGDKLLHIIVRLEENLTVLRTLGSEAAIGELTHLPGGRGLGLTRLSKCHEDT